MFERSVEHPGVILGEEDYWVDIYVAREMHGGMPDSAAILASAKWQPASPTFNSAYEAISNPISNAPILISFLAGIGFLLWGYFKRNPK